MAGGRFHQPWVFYLLFYSSMAGGHRPPAMGILFSILIFHGWWTIPPAMGILFSFLHGWWTSSTSYKYFYLLPSADLSIRGVSWHLCFKAPASIERCWLEFVLYSSALLAGTGGALGI